MAGGKLCLANIMVVSMVLALLSWKFIITVAQDDPQTLELGHGCSPQTYKYVNESAFQNNLNTAFNSLASNISSSNSSFFATSISNNGPTDAVYALLLCRKYLTSKECLECFTTAEKGLIQACSSQGYNGGRFLLDGCFLRYENATFFNEGTDGGFSNYCASIYDTKPREFNQTAEMLLSQLIVNASNDDGYAVGFASISSTTVYGLVQCVPTISKATCQECLKEAQIIVVNNCLPMQQGRGLEAGCFMRYATYPFYGGFNSNRGYTAPEYAVHGQLSEKADVYSYGVLVLEIVSGRKCVIQRLPAHLQLLLEWAWRQYQNDQALEIVDAKMLEYPKDKMLRIINIALLCCQASPAMRPTMSGVVSMLTTASEINVRPSQPAFIDTDDTTFKPSFSATPTSSAPASDSAQSHGSITVSLFPR